MKFGVFILAQRRSYKQSSAEVIHNAMEQTVTAEAAGFNTAWFAEHHFNKYSLTPSPLMAVAHAAGRTRTIRLGTAVCILPLYQPARFLAEVGFADTVSDGRLELGVGSGYQQFEFERFGTTVDDSWHVYNEFLDVIDIGLQGKNFEYQGKYIQMMPTSIAVDTVQKPGVPMWVTSNNPKTLQRAMRDGHNLFVTALLKGNEAIRDLRLKLEGIAQDDGQTLDDMTGKIGFLRCGYVSDNKAEIDHYLDCARYQRRISESLKQRRQLTDDGYMMKEVPMTVDPDIEELRAALPVGCVNEVVDKLLAEIEILKPRHIALQTQLGDFDQTTMLRQIERWGERIIPEVRKALGAKAAA
ncbi:LLM class flavin-dependent oxidoreductase [Falsigemmobacter intermedius]|uniref:LLM class flavin-dependent oxidoreductase n=1 Tax=Falsigemmobacter intermedius TaxID=1553448 RepID=A0A444MB45_9RHOB|nr:LLM class flavin-dependent oxidoreductase [Falsigemmobacter intermedius]RWY40956.1 LLM class flavin-dependent oxidoreductase [Falsigemmobacter intermedius]